MRVCFQEGWFKEECLEAKWREEQVCLVRWRGCALYWWFGNLLGSFNTWSRGGGCDTWGRVLHWWIQFELSVALRNQVRPEGYTGGSSQSWGLPGDQVRVWRLHWGIQSEQSVYRGIQLELSITLGESGRVDGMLGCLVRVEYYTGVSV